MQLSLTARRVGLSPVALSCPALAIGPILQAGQDVISSYTMPLIEPLNAHVRSLLLQFFVRTVVLSALAASATFFFSSTLSPYGYDTSSTHLFLDDQSLFEGLPGRLAVALTRWDAIYFVSNSERGYIWEQEWAFQRGLGVVVNSARALIPNLHKRC